MLELDWTLPVASVVFLLTLWGMNTFLFRPLWATLDERRRRVEGPRSEAESARRRIAEVEETCKARIREARREGYEVAESMRRESLKKRQERIVAAREEAERRLGEARRLLSEEMEAARKRLEESAEDLARLITARILGQS